MDTTEVRAAGMRVQKQTFDQAIDRRTENRTYQSQIFGGGPTTAPPARQSLAKQSDIFGVQAAGQKTEIKTAPRQSGTFQSSIFTFDQTPQQRPTTAVVKSQVFSNEQSAPAKKQYQSKNNEHRLQDHGKDFLFGKSDYTDYKTLKRAATSSQFEPKLDYNPEDRAIRELYGNEISKDGLLPHRKVDLKKQSSAQVPKKEYDPTTRKEELLQSNIFHSDEKRNSAKTKPEPLTASTAKWDTQFAKSKNDPKEEIDPDTYARDKKEKELQSSVFGQKQAPAKKPKEKEEKKEEPEKKSANIKKERLLASNLDWKTTDTVKNLKDFAPNKDQQTNDEETLKVTPSQKKFQGLQSTLDTHTYQANLDVEKEEKISKKNLKYKTNILTREEKPKTASKQISKNQSVKQIANKDAAN